MKKKEYTLALSSLRKQAKLEKKIAELEDQLAELTQDQFLFEQDVWDAALKEFEKETGEIL